MMERTLTDTSMALYFAPGACSRVVLVALEEAGARYKARPLSLADGQQRSADYLALNPKGKVPLLATAGGVLSESLAILAWLDACFVQAGLLPPASDAWGRAQAMSWLAWSVGTLHPLVYRARMPARIHPDAATHAALRGTALAEMAQQLPVAEEVLADGRSWLMGEAWCVADTHLCWAFGRGVDSGLDATQFPHLAALVERHSRRPAFQRALARETARC